MSWLRIDDGFADHQKVDVLSDKAFRLHVSAMCLCARKLTDGIISAKDLRVLTVIAGTRAKHVSELENAGLWTKTGAVWAVHDYLKYNPTAEQVKAERAKAAHRQAVYRKSNAVTNGVTNASRNAAPSRPVPKKLLTEKTLSCPACGVGFLTQQRLGEHLSDVHHIDEGAA